MNTIVIILKCLAFPFYSLFSRRVGFSVFIPGIREWWLFTRGKFVPIKGLPGVSSLEYFRHFVPKMDGVVFDVGGELGLEARQFSIMVGERGKVFTFECFPDHVKRLRNLAHRYSNIQVVDRACWNRGGRIQLFIGHTPGSNTPLANIKGLAGQPLGDESADPVFVEADTLDNMWKSYAAGVAVDFLKMDIEGAEIEALQGANELLQNTSKVVVAAYHERDGVKTANAVSEILAKVGFSTQIDDNYHVYGSRDDGDA